MLPGEKTGHCQLPSQHLMLQNMTLLKPTDQDLIEYHCKINYCGNLNPQYSCDGNVCLIFDTTHAGRILLFFFLAFDRTISQIFCKPGIGKPLKQSIKTYITALFVKHSAI